MDLTENISNPNKPARASPIGTGRSLPRRLGGPCIATPGSSFRATRPNLEAGAQALEEVGRPLTLATADGRTHFSTMCLRPRGPWGKGAFGRAFGKLFLCYFDKVDH